MAVPLPIKDLWIFRIARAILIERRVEWRNGRPYNVRSPSNHRWNLTPRHPPLSPIICSRLLHNSIPHESSVAEMWLLCGCGCTGKGLKGAVVYIVVVDLSCDSVLLPYLCLSICTRSIHKSISIKRCNCRNWQYCSFFSCGHDHARPKTTTTRPLSISLASSVSCV